MKEPSQGRVASTRGIRGSISGLKGLCVPFPPLTGSEKSQTAPAANTITTAITIIAMDEETFWFMSVISIYTLNRSDVFHAATTPYRLYRALEGSNAGLPLFLRLE